jgi:hypothetical protein
MLLAMKLSLAVTALLVGKAFAFAPCSNHQHGDTSSIAKTITMMSSSPISSGGDGNDGSSRPKKKVLTAADVMAKSKSSPIAAAAASSSPENGDVPKIFSPAIYNDFQSTLLLLEKRINAGPSSLTHSEIQQFEEQTTRIVMEMKDYLMDPVGCGEAIRKGYQTQEEEGAVAAASVAPPLQPEQSATAATIGPPSMTTTSPIVETSSSSTNINHRVQDVVVNLENDASSNEANEEYANFGLARGTTNTYVIPGMEEMSPEEYRDKLQETISARQVRKRDLVLLVHISVRRRVVFIILRKMNTILCGKMFCSITTILLLSLSHHSSIYFPFGKKKSFCICVLCTPLSLGGKEETKSILGYYWQS